MRPILTAASVLVLLSSCALAPDSGSSDIAPSAAVIAAADHPISGVFRLQVRGSGRRDGYLYLNSESDYRDQRCLTIAIPDTIATALAIKLGGDPAAVLAGKVIRVKGEARRVKIGMFEHDGTPMKEYYYQTHVRINDAAQIEIL